MILTLIISCKKKGKSISIKLSAYYVTAVMLSEASNDCELCNDAERCSERWPPSQMNHVSVHWDLEEMKRFLKLDVDNKVKFLSLTFKNTDKYCSEYLY